MGAEVLASAGFSGVAVGTDAPYSPACDLWSLGVLLYTMLSKHLPFAATTSGRDTDAAILERVAVGTFEFAPEACWGTVSASAKDVITQLLLIDPARRMTMDGLRRHTWCADAVSSAYERAAAEAAASGSEGAVAGANAADGAATSAPAPEGATRSSGSSGRVVANTSNNASTRGAPELPPSEEDVARRQRYFMRHQASLESTLSDAVNRVMTDRPSDPVGCLARLLSTRTSLRNGAGVAVPIAEPLEPAAVPASAWSTSGAQHEIERALENALNQVLEKQPEEPLVFIVEHLKIELNVRCAPQTSGEL